MDYDFNQFLKEAKDICKSKADFVTRIMNEIKAVSKINDGRRYKDKQLYLRRLDNAKFSIEKGVIKEKDRSNAALIKLIESLK
jgi:hypothetical protein